MVPEKRSQFLSGQKRIGMSEMVVEKNISKRKILKMAKRKRPCLVETQIWDGNENKGFGTNVTLKFEGLFHQWGNEAIETNDQGFVNFTVGIVEDPSGKVWTINPNHIKFINN